MTYIVTRIDKHGKAWFLGTLTLPGFGESATWGPEDMRPKVFTTKREAERIARRHRGTVERVEN